MARKFFLKSPKCGGWRLWGLVGLLVSGVMLASLAGCANLGYYWQNTQGHLAVMHAAKPVKDWLDDASTPQAT